MKWKNKKPNKKKYILYAKTEYKSILNIQVELIGYIKEILLGIWAILLTINRNLRQTLIFGLIKLESPMLLGNEAVYQSQNYIIIFLLIII